jgi:two-component system, cell cycle sensor histidine kinase and response regulator CckA
MAVNHTNCLPEDDNTALKEFGNKRKTVLVVDDDPTVLEITSMMLRRLGYTVVEADKGEVAFELFESICKEIAFVITDLELPDMDGQAVCNAFKEIDASARVVLATGEDIGSIREADDDHPFDGFLQKPFSLKHLQRIVELFDQFHGKK